MKKLSLFIFILILNYTFNIFAQTNIAKQATWTNSTGNNNTLQVIQNGSLIDGIKDLPMSSVLDQVSANFDKPIVITKIIIYYQRGNDELLTIDNGNNIHLDVRLPHSSTSVEITFDNVSTQSVGFYFYLTYTNVGEIEIYDNVALITHQWSGSLTTEGNISHNGNVTIGNGQIDSYLKIKTNSRAWWAGVGANSSDNKFVIYDSTANTRRLTIGLDGNVGIGYDVANYKLDVNGVGHFGTSALIGTNIAAGYYQDVTNGAYRSLNVAGTTGYCFQSYNGTATTMYVGLQGAYAGRVGIGTIIPSYTLDVNGVGRFGSSALIGTGIAAGYYQDIANGAYRSLNIAGNTGYYFQNYNGVSTKMYVGLQGSYAGMVGIGTTTPGYTVDVIGTIRAKEMKVDLKGADFVFDNSYKLLPLEELNNYVKQNKHLPEISSASQMQLDGVGIGDLQNKLLQKIEELTLYVIEKDKEISLLKNEKTNELIEQKKKNIDLESQIAALRELINKK